MEEILGTIYCWFNGFFSQELEWYLWGYDGNDYSKSIVFNTIGLITLVSSLVMVLIYYYLLNHPRFNRWWHWIIVLVINSVINLFIGYGRCWQDLDNGYIPDILIYERDEQGQIINTLITSADCWGFGISNCILALLFFAVFSIGLKWWSSNCKYSPF